MSGTAISFQNEGIRFSLSSPVQIKSWLSKAALSEGFRIKQIAYHFCGDDFLLSMNRQFLGHDTYTDIITFEYTTEEDPELIEGEVFISIERVRENAAKYSQDFRMELARVMVHGLLHLCGYKDKPPSGKRLMTKKENEYLDKLTIKSGR